SRALMRSDWPPSVVGVLRYSRSSFCMSRAIVLSYPSQLSLPGIGGLLADCNTAFEKAVGPSTTSRGCLAATVSQTPPPARTWTWRPLSVTPTKERSKRPLGIIYSTAHQPAGQRLRNYQRRLKAQSAPAQSQHLRSHTLALQRQPQRPAAPFGQSGAALAS